MQERKHFALALAAVLCASGVAAGAPGTEFTYQGELRRDGLPVNGTADLMFTLFDAETEGTAIGDELLLEQVALSDGHFAVELDFGTGAFMGPSFFVEIAVRSPAGSGEFETPAPRQPLHPVPLALAMPGLHTIPQGISTSIIGGSALNSIPSQARGAIVAGGGEDFGGIDRGNHARAGYCTVSGGRGNVAGPSSFPHVSVFATVSGGVDNAAIGEASTVGGGRENLARDSGATVAGGTRNETNGPDATIGGGAENQATGRNATVAGGSENQARGMNAAIGGGSENDAGGRNAAIPGGSRNVAGGDNSLAAGYRARAVHHNAFVWGDGTDASFSSTLPDTFIIRARNGVGIGTNRPEGRFHVRHGAAANGWPVVIENDTVGSFVGGIRISDEGFLDLTNKKSGPTGWARLNSFGNWSTVSDRRLKEEIEPMEPVLRRALNLRPVRYHYIDEPAGSMKSFGLVAQEVQEDFPTLVNEGGVLTMNYSGLSVVAIKALQELKLEKDREIEALRERLSKHEQEFAEQKRMMEALRHQIAAGGDRGDE